MTKIIRGGLGNTTMTVITKVDVKAERAKKALLKAEAERERLLEIKSRLIEDEAERDAFAIRKHRSFTPARERKFFTV